MAIVVCGQHLRESQSNWSPIRKMTSDGNDQEVESNMSTTTCRRFTELPCHTVDPDMWFSEVPAELERAKQLCEACPIRAQCLAAALERAEPWGVWGGEIFERGEVIARKRPRGRPRKNPAVGPAAA